MKELRNFLNNIEEMENNEKIISKFDLTIFR
jgi:hypothetical protein